MRKWWDFYRVAGLQKGAALEITSSTPPLLDAKGDPGAEDAAEAAAGAQTA